MWTHQAHDDNDDDNNDADDNEGWHITMWPDQVTWYRYVLADYVTSWSISKLCD